MNESDISTLTQKKIRSTIPLSAMMEFSIVDLSPRSIFVNAPLKPNVNIHGTGFAGSIYALGVLTGWTLVDYIMSEFDIKAMLVVAHAEIKYRSPVTEDIVCKSMLTDDSYQKFINSFQNNKKSGLVLDIQIGNLRNAVLTANYIAIHKE